MSLLLNLVIALSTVAFAEESTVNKVGNGGDGIFCENKEGQLLDFYEVKLSKKTTEKDPLIIAQKQIDQLEDIAPKLYSLYSKRLKEISSEIDFRTDIDLEDIKDSKHLYKPKSKKCEFLQIAVRKNHIGADEKRFIIRKDLWEKLSPLHQAGLYTHEIIYEHFSKLSEKDSIKARKVNAYIYSDNIQKEKFWKLIEDLKIAIYP